MKIKTIQEEVYQLHHAYTKQSPLSKEDLPKGRSIAEAYDIQHKVLNEKVNMENDQHVGYKISLTSEETQQLFQATSPLYGALTETSLTNGVIELDEMLSPLIEIELMFMVNESLLPDDDEEAMLEKVSIAPGIEVPDSRFYDWFPKLSLDQVIADSAVAGKVMFGKPVEGVTTTQLENLSGELRYNGEVIAQGNSSEVLGNPVHAVKWLNEELAKDDRRLEKGMIISSGTFILPKVLQRGTYEVSFEHIGKVSLQVK